MDLSNKLSIADVDLRGKRVLVRVDYNVPLGAAGRIEDNKRIVASLPTLEYALSHGARALVLMSHLGRPDGKRVESMSLRPAAAELERLLGRRVVFLPDCVGPEVEAACASPAPGSIVMLENLRFHVEEEGSARLPDGTKERASPEAVAAFRASLSALGDVCVNDAFGTVHRAHSSIVGIGLRERVAGLLVQKELLAFSQLLQSKDGRIDVAILGGAKVADKIQLIQSLLGKVGTLLVGGGMAYTFLAVVQGVPIGGSLFDEKGAAIVSDIVSEARAKGVSLVLPVDSVAASRYAPDAETKAISHPEEGIPDGWIGLDIGPKTVAAFRAAILSARSVVWNGPVGMFEWDAFAVGTKAVCEAMVEATKAHHAITIVGGGDSASAVAKWDAESGFTHVSTGGGASIELLEGKALPGIEALSTRQ